MEERLIRQQQEMEEDQRWLEKEERFLVTAFRKCPPTLSPAGVCGKGSSFPKQESWLPLQFLKLAVVGVCSPGVAFPVSVSEGSSGLVGSEV